MKRIFVIILLALIASDCLAQSIYSNTAPSLLVDGTLASDITNTTATEVIPGQGENVRTYLTSACVQNAHATVGTQFIILNGSTPRWKGFAAPVGGGFCAHFPAPLRGEANTAWKIQAVTSGASINASFSGYKSAR